jgi:hypothetical protein
MGNINAPQIEYFESFAKELIGKFRRLQNLVDHPTTSGDYHEEILRVVLRNFLSKRFSVKSGFVYAGPQSVSKQVDLLIVDENSPAAYIFQEGDFAIVMPKAVVAAVEVKTSLKAGDFDQSIDNIASVKRLMEFPADLAGIVFGFDGTNPTDHNLDKWFKRPVPSQYADNEVVVPDAIMFFNSNSLLLRCNENQRIGPDGKYYHRLIAASEDHGETSALQLSIVLAMIINACEHKQFRDTHQFVDRNGFNLFQAEKGRLLLDRFAFGEGQSTTPPQE